MAAKGWGPGTQCVAKCDHKTSKKNELPFHKGDLLTITEIVNEKGVYKAKHNKTGEEGLIARNNVREREAIRVDPHISLMPWFHGKISGEDAVQQLQPQEDGLFLVRESIRHPGDYVLCVSSHSGINHYRVIYKDNKLTIDENDYFYNLIELIEHYRKDAFGLVTRLSKPKHKEGAKSATEELSKAGWLLSMERLTLGDKVGEGEFGDVFQADYMGQKVAVKNIKCDVMAQAFLEETAVMTNLQHKNLVTLLGVIVDNGLHIITDFMSKGNLVNYLRTRGRSVVTVKHLIRFGLDVCEGMEYLESKKLVHRDLAARNILISDQNVAKVSDFGLAKGASNKQDQAKLPIKWTAPEALKQHKFSTKSDVWSYGIFLWELFSYGRAPYPKMSLTEVTAEVANGYRMEPPEQCPAPIYETMKCCWEQDPGKRPTFKKIKEKMEKERRRIESV
ncbi:megakaryocyte-associated tyrosine-protein kinase isoform X2 [Callorhinchus milii]|uniref:Tyrosine-protein kinase n=1 Tax=Callorhinchus milii TaxID=7868 RepID=V9KCU6_CALMI|nr:megakaryocyte-associated tyrosine-protein kinase isoform X2 [Callorhinchus milii]|eukprot:gi/632978923/ref/XP_007906181.1/ PREDICTED: megakaryocyte-associated tyrosine-protein kinase isoform X2 [Callorhinchus milii]